MMNRMLPVAVLAMAALTVPASAEDGFSTSWLLPAKSQVVFGSVTADAGGTVEVYDFRAGSKGQMLGSHAVAAGENPWVRIDLEPAQYHSVVAVLTVDGAVMAEKVVEFHRGGR